MPPRIGLEPGLYHTPSWRSSSQVVGPCEWAFGLFFRLGSADPQEPGLYHHALTGKLPPPGLAPGEHLGLPIPGEAFWCTSCSFMKVFELLLVCPLLWRLFHMGDSTLSWRPRQHSSKDCRDEKVRHLEGSLERCSIAWKGVSWGDLDIWLKCLLDSSLGGCPGMSFWEEVQDQTQNSLEGLCIYSGLECLRVPQEELKRVSEWRNVSLLDLLLLQPDNR